MIDLKDIITITGMPGLFKIIKPTNNGVLVEPLSNDPKRFVVNQNKPVSKLEDNSIYTQQDSVSLTDLFVLVKEKFGTDLQVTPKSDEAALREFMETVLPEYDRERVYASNIRKLITWYTILNEFQAPQPADA